MKKSLKVYLYYKDVVLLSFENEANVIHMRHSIKFKSYDYIPI
jgi:hypothetical protein